MCLSSLRQKRIVHNDRDRKGGKFMEEKKIDAMNDELTDQDAAAENEAVSGNGLKDVAGGADYTILVKEAAKRIIKNIN